MEASKVVAKLNDFIQPQGKFIEECRRKVKLLHGEAKKRENKKEINEEKENEEKKERKFS